MTAGKANFSSKLPLNIARRIHITRYLHTIALLEHLSGGRLSLPEGWLRSEDRIDLLCSVDVERALCELIVSDESADW